MTGFRPAAFRAASLAATAALTGLATLAVPVTASAAAPPAPTHVRVSAGSSGTFLTWAASGASHFVVEQASDAAFRTGVRSFTDRDGRDRQFTPPALVKGHGYYWRIRSFAGTSGSRWSPAVHAVAAMRPLALRVATYNVIENSADGTLESGTRIAPWSQRVGGAVSLLRQSGAGVVALEEAAGWVARVRGPRQADDVAARLGFVLAHTEVAPDQPHYFRTGVYVLYDGMRYTAAAPGGHWNVGDTRWAAYQLLRSRATGATFLFVSVHETTGATRTGDTARQKETTNLINDATAYAAVHGHAPVVYAGDFNSHDGRNHVFDGPGVAMRAAHAADAFKSAVTRVNVSYDSANLYLRTPPASARSIDRVFASPGVGIVSWRQPMNLTHGRFVGVMPSDHNPVAADLTLPY